MKYELEAYISLGKLIRTSALLDGGLMYRSTFLVPSRAYLELLGGADPTRISAGEIQSFLRYRINTTERQFYPQSGYTLHLHLTEHQARRVESKRTTNRTSLLGNITHYNRV